MKWLKEKLLYIVLIYLNFNFILRLAEKSLYIKNFNYGFTSLLFLIGFLIYWFYDYVLRRGVYKILFTVSLFSMGGIFYYKKAEVAIDVFNKYLVKNIIILNDLIYEGATTYFFQYKIVISLILPLIIIIILWITFRFMKKFILVVSLAIVITLWFSNCYIVVKEHLFLYLFISSFTFIIMTYLRRMEEYKSEGVKVSLKFGYILIYGVVASLLISKLTLMLPQEYKGRDFSSVGNYFENKFVDEGSGISSANKNRYSLSASGYSSNDKKLGGPVTLNYQEVFKVKGEKPHYLKGNVKDFYDGSKWSKSNESYYKKTDSGEMKFLNYGKYLSGSKKSITIYPDKKFKTNTIFVPNYTFNVSGVEDTVFYDKTPTVLSEKVAAKAYNVDFYEYVEEIKTIEDIKSYREKFLERNYTTNGEYYFPMDYLLQPRYMDINTLINKNSYITERFSYRNSEDYKIMISYGEYLQVPENISNRIYDLVRDITKDSKSSIEKVLEIKKYLTKNYEYELQVSVVPEEKEFIDHFLFEEKKGYCTYFNTAMTVMCRIAGVPARYVEGFKTANKTDGRGLYGVSNADAHAWCEVLLGASEYSNMWTIADSSPTASEDIERRLKELEEEQRNNGERDDLDINMKHTPQNKMDNIDAAEGEAGSKLQVLSDTQLQRINILTAIILFILMSIIKVIKKRREILKACKVATLYNYYLYRLSVIRIVKPEYQSDLEFAQDMPNSQLKERLEVLVQGAYEEFYGKRSVKRLNNKEYYDFLEEYLKEYQGKVEYLLKKYLG